MVMITFTSWHSLTVLSSSSFLWEELAGAANEKLVSASSTEMTVEGRIVKSLGLVENVAAGG